MRTVALVVGAFVVGPFVPKAHAAPACFPRAGKPRLVVTARTVTACAADDKAETCFVVRPGASPTAATSPPPKSRYRPSHLIQSNVDGIWRACFDSLCKPMGKATLAAVKAVEEDPMQAVVDITTDSQVLVIDKKRAFVLATDRELIVKPPREYRRGKDLPIPTLMDFTVIGSLVIASWYDCAGPCGKSVVIDRVGANTGSWFPRGQPIALGGSRMLIVPTDDDATATVVDMTTAKQLGKVSLDKSGVLNDIVGERVDDNTAVAMWSTFDGPYQLAWISVPRTKAPSLAKVAIASCP